MKACAPLLAATLLAVGGCSYFQPTPVASGWTHWVCDSQVSVQWRYTDTARSGVEARIEPGSEVHRLESEPGSGGQLYSDGVLALHVQGSGGLVYWVATNDLLGRGCKTP
jgi:hypothetical protein